jgi:hypothetical protein
MSPQYIAAWRLRAVANACARPWRGGLIVVSSWAWFASGGGGFLDADPRGKP